MSSLNTRSVIFTFIIGVITGCTRGNKRAEILHNKRKTNTQIEKTKFYSKNIEPLVPFYFAGQIDGGKLRCACGVAGEGV